MTKFRVSVPYRLWHHFEIEAEDYDDAMDKAYRHAAPYQGGFGTGIHLASKSDGRIDLCDDADWDEAEAEEVTE